MRKFNYITDYSLINSSVRGYIIELEKIVFQDLTILNSY